MRFRPCIDIHNGQVKQIVGGSLADEGDRAAENFVSGQDAAFYAAMYAKDGLAGGHVIMLNARTSPYYEATKAQAVQALRTAPGTLQAGGGITPENAAFFLDAGAAGVIVTSYVFRDGAVDMDALERMISAVGRENLILDLSCREAEGQYLVVTDRWQKFTKTPVTPETLEMLGGCCAEFLVHGVDAEGKQGGPQAGLVRILGRYAAKSGKSVTYAGGIGSFEDLETVRREGGGRVDVTVGSALDLFGGSMSYRKLLGMTGDDRGRFQCHLDSHRLKNSLL